MPIKKKKNEIASIESFELYYACKHNKMGVLVEAEKSGDAFNLERAIEIACKAENEEVVEFIINWGTRIHYSFTNMPLLIASKNGNADLVLFLLKKGFKTKGAMIAASSKGNTNIVEILLENGADINEKSESGKTSLMISFWKNHLRTGMFLIEKGASFEEKDKDGQTLLENEIYANKIKITEILLKAGAKLPDHILFEARSPEMAQLLISYGADLKIKGSNGSTLVHNAAMGKLDLLKFYLSKGLDPRAEDRFWKTPLIYASDTFNRETLKYLINFGVSEVEVNVIWKNSEQSPKFTKTLLQLAVPLPKNSRIIKRVDFEQTFKRFYGVKAMNLLLCARKKAAESPFFEEKMSLDLFKKVYFIVQKVCREHEWQKLISGN